MRTHLSYLLEETGEAVQTRNADHIVSCSRRSADRLMQTAFPQKNRRNKNSHTKDQKGQEPEACPKTRGFPMQQSAPHIHMARHKVNFIKNFLTDKNCLYICWFKDSFQFPIILPVFQAKLLQLLNHSLYQVYKVNNTTEFGTYPNKQF